MHIPFEKLTLANGLDVILHQDRTTPLAAVNVWYHVGSKDEEPGRRGFAHLFEHLMFEGSQHHNRSFFEPLQQAGATLNGSTNTDRTNYWENVPANYLEFALWLEADRMGFLLEALDETRFNVQRDVVKNERRQNYENRPYGMASSWIQSQLFPLPHPYNWWTIGEPEDLDASSLDDAKAFFRRYYGPSNASLCIAGDFDRDAVLEWVHRYFADIPPLPTLSRAQRRDSGLQGPVDLTMHDRVHLPRLYWAWPTPPRFSAEEPALTLLADMLGGSKTSRLYRTLVYERQVAQSVMAYHSAQELAGQFIVEVTVADGHSTDEVGQAVEEEITRLRESAPSSQELERSRNRVTTRFVRQLERLGGFGGRADLLNACNVLGGDPQRVNTYLERIDAVRPPDVQGVVEAHLNNRRVRLQVLPEPHRNVAASVTDRSQMPSPAPTPLYSAPVPERHTLSNGLNVLVAPRPDLPLVTFGLLLRAGSVTDPTDRPGQAYLTARLLSEGTTSRSSQDIAEGFEFIGSQLNTLTGREHVLLFTETLNEHWPRGLELIADVARNPTFPEHELTRIRREHLTNLRRVREEPVTIAERLSRMLLFSRDSAYGHPVTGTEVSVGSLDREHLASHLQRCYCPDQATLIVVGNVSSAEVRQRAQEFLGDWRESADRPAQAPTLPGTNGEQPTTLYLVDKEGTTQSVIRAGQVGIPRSHADYFPLTVLNYAFGGQFSARLNSNLRQEKGYTYGYRSSIDWYRTSSALLVGGGVYTEVTKDALSETLREYRDIRTARPISQEEFVSAKDGLLRGIPASFETAFQVLEHVVDIALFDLPDSYYATYAQSIEQVSLEAVQRTAREHLREQGLAVLVVGDRKAIEAPLQELGLPMVFLDHEGSVVE